MEFYKTSCECVSFWCGVLSPLPFLCLKSSWCCDAGTPQVCQAGNVGEPIFHNPRGAGCMGSPIISSTLSTYQCGDLSIIFLVQPSMHWPLYDVSTLSCNRRALCGDLRPQDYGRGSYLPWETPPAGPLPGVFYFIYYTFRPSFNFVDTFYFGFRWKRTVTLSIH